MATVEYVTDTHCVFCTYPIGTQKDIPTVQDAALYPSLHDEGGVCYVSMGNFNATEQRVRHTL